MQEGHQIFSLLLSGTRWHVICPFHCHGNMVLPMKQEITVTSLCVVQYCTNFTVVTKLVASIYPKCDGAFCVACSPNAICLWSWLYSLQIYFFLISLFFLFSVPCTLVVHCHSCNCIMKANDFVTFAVSGLSSRCSNLIDCCSNQETNNGQSPLSQGPNKEEDNMSLGSRFKDPSISLGKQSPFSYGRCLKFLSHTINVVMMEVY